ncbi:hypothetical protein SAMN05421766_102192 [Zobellia uliginosa]|uniref:Bacteriocin-type signal sequence-containing protein n=1 Tax=Zobellia uliginosa TaxID=143224 RepID=A0ABY1KLQ6_9FLAO|nr:hypothetical protein [Zobellia uliginosa]MDO6518588.1 hypothetical protein [Zobellia uliginosa]SIS47942.1 hypothetical protein SAMN05421766_102192 [Zobellia uliginosa]
MKNSNPEKFLDTQELSALENQTLKGGTSMIESVEEEDKKKKEKKVTVEK